MRQSEQNVGSLWVCWEKPFGAIPPDATVLSFLPPEVEEEFAKLVPVERARKVSQAIRPEARRAYLDLVARLGIANCGGRTFRERLTNEKGASQWWYHPVAFRDCETDPTFNQIIAIFTIDVVAKRLGVNDLVVVGGAREVVEVLRCRFRVIAQQTVRSRRWFHIGKSLARRVVEGVRQCTFVLRPVRLPEGRIAVFFSSLWDWSFDLDPDGSVRDRYYRDLPHEMKTVSIGAAGWLVWIDSNKKTPLSRARSLANRHKSASPLVFLQSLLRLSDVIKAHADARPLMVFLRWRTAVMRELQYHHYDFAPLFSLPLISGFLNESLAHAALVTTATERAHRRYQCRAFVSFLEHFPHARAGYQGVAQAATGTTTFAIQHASYSTDKTFLSLHAAIELRGEPDQCRVPQPDFVCAMGELGRDLFLACGYDASQVLLTGSPRYDSLRENDQLPPDRQLAVSVNVLMVATLNVPMEMEMMSAVAAAARDLPKIRLCLRSHPARPVREEDAAASGVELTTGTLEENLTSADLVIFTYSTVAEEAFVSGKPAWQWLPMGFNGSALASVYAVPQFGSVAEIRKAFIDFIEDRSRFVPDPAARRAVFQKLFFKGDGRAASRVAEQIEAAVRDTPSIPVDAAAGTEVSS